MKLMNFVILWLNRKTKIDLAKILMIKIMEIR